MFHLPPNLNTAQTGHCRELGHKRQFALARVRFRLNKALDGILHVGIRQILTEFQGQGLPQFDTSGDFLNNRLAPVKQANNILEIRTRQKIASSTVLERLDLERDEISSS